MTATVPAAKPTLASFAGGGGTGAAKGERVVDYDQDGRMRSATYERSNLRPGLLVEDPAVIEEPALTNVVYPGRRASVDEIGNMLIKTGA